MKKNLLLLVLALIGMGGFTACNNDDELLVQEQTNTKPVVIRASIGEVSRLALGESEGGQTKLSWGTGDAFALTIDDKSYTFNWKSGNDFEYANDNGDFPETFESAGTITATYPATAAGGLSVQSGTKTNVGNYMQMTAELAVTAGQPTTDLNLSFEHQTSVVEITLENNQYANLKAVVELRTQAEAMYSTPTEDEQKVKFDESGKLTVYFAVSPTDAEVSGWYIGLSFVDTFGDTYYDTAPLSDLKLDASKMYKVSKGSSDLKTAYKIDSDTPNTVAAYDAMGLYKWNEMVSQNTTSNIINLELIQDITLPTDGITLDANGLPDKGNWTPLEDPADEYDVYRGTIDGKNHTIKNMYIVNSSSYANRIGFIGEAEATIKNLKFDNVKIVASGINSYYIGVVSGISSGIIDNCHVTNSILKCTANSSKSLGGLVGKLLSPNHANATPKIINSSFSGTVEGNRSVGGIAGDLECCLNGYSYITNCSVKGSVKGEYLVGGIAGYMGEYTGEGWSSGDFAALEMCTNEATVTGAVSGGIVGRLTSYGYVVGCTNKGEVYGTYYNTSYAVTKSGTGGIVGLIEIEKSDKKSLVIGCRNLSDKVYLSATEGSDRIGGIVGYQNKAESGVYGSYFMPSVANDTYGDHAQNAIGVAVTGHTNSINYSFNSPDDAQLSSLLSYMNTYIENGFTAAAEANFYKDDKSAYKDYRWSWTSGSWPEFKAPVAP